MKKRKKEVLGALLVSILFLVGGNVYKNTFPDLKNEFDLAGKPSLGDGPIKIVLFEDLLCSSCKMFTENVFSKIASNYLETGKAEIFFIPVAFSERAKFVANAALSVYNIAPSRFISFLLELSHSNLFTNDDILGVAAKVGDISIAQLETSIVNDQYYQEIDQNLIWAKDLFGPDFGTPMLFVNGQSTSTKSYEVFEMQLHRLGLQ